MSRLRLLLFVLLAGGTLAACEGDSLSPLSAEESSPEAGSPLVMASKVGTMAYCYEPEDCGGTSGPTVEGLYVDDVSPYSCTNFFVSGQNADADNLDDECEWQLADAFRPQLNFAIGEDWPDGEPRWAAKLQTVCAQPSCSSTVQGVRIIYLLSYYWDGGPDFGHAGDSEFIVVDLIYELDEQYYRWKVQRVFLSAHWKSIFDKSDWVWHSGFEYYHPYHRTAPVIWVSKNKHANYESRNECNKYPFDGDGCSYGWDERITIYRDENVGASYQWSMGNDCVPSRWPGLFPGTECYWTTQAFGGWHGLSDVDKSGPYNRALAAFM